ncbi:unnamed protein product [Closterium sp. NIES-65]|nr:unnamed protein product [Closterium sp. NIES-65]
MQKRRRVLMAGRLPACQHTSLSALLRLVLGLALVVICSARFQIHPSIERPVISRRRLENEAIRRLLGDQAFARRHLASAFVGTVVTLFAKPALNGKFVNVQAPAPGECLTLPPAFNGRTESAAIAWNVKSAASGGQTVKLCGSLSLWTSDNCGGYSSVFVVPGGWREATASRYDYPDTPVKFFTGVYSPIRSISCANYVPNPCTGYRCPPNSQCALEGGTAPTCACVVGFTMRDGECVNTCQVTACPANSSCALVNDRPVCACKDGLLMRNGACIDPCADTACKQPATCAVNSTTGAAYCACPPNWRLRPDGLSCSDPCAAVQCPSASSCVAVSGAATCACPRGFSFSKATCVSSSVVKNADYLDVHNGVRYAVGVPEVKWNDTLAKLAATWATQLVTNTSVNGNQCGTLVHGMFALPSPSLSTSSLKAKSLNTKAKAGPRKSSALPSSIQFASPPLSSSSSSAAASLRMGQNLAALSGLAAGQVVGARAGLGVWLEEGGRYTRAVFVGDAGGSDSGCRGGNWKACGHYTQMVWRSTTSVGCATATCPSGAAQVWVCNYYPPGNVINSYPY